MANTQKAPKRVHDYQTTVRWTGNRGPGTETFTGYDRSYDTLAEGRPALQGSSDPNFRGDPAKWNPELLLLAAASQCHMLWFLHLASTSGVVVTDYEDHAHAAMVEDADGGGRFTEIVLRPVVTVASQAMAGLAQSLHPQASARCFIANSLNFKVGHAAEVRVAARVDPDL